MSDVGREAGGAPALDRRDLVSGCGVPTNIECSEGRISGPLTTTKSGRADRRTVDEVAEMVVDPGLDRIARRGGEGERRHLITVAAQGGLCPLRRLERSTVMKALRPSSSFAISIVSMTLLMWSAMRISAESG